MNWNVAKQHPAIASELEAGLQAVEPLDTRWWSLRQGRWKLIRSPELAGWRFELYDLGRDPHELTDVAMQQPEVVARLSKDLGDHIEALPEDPQSEARGRAETERVERRLKTLGYFN